jgi:glutamyl-tRNA synthetase
VGRFFFVDVPEFDQAAVEKHLAAAGVSAHLAALDRQFAALPAFDAASIEAALRTAADALGVKAATLIHAVRVAVTGKTASPGLFEVLALLGRERTHRRLAAAQALSAAPRR